MKLELSAGIIENQIKHSTTLLDRNFYDTFPTSLFDHVDRRRRSNPWSALTLPPAPLVGHSPMGFGVSNPEKDRDTT
jgi:hypothetical protein